MFLNPLFLLGLGALAVPVIIHLMHSTKAEVVRFSSIRFLKNCQRRSARRTRLKQVVLMALRMLLLALIVLGFAKPVLHSESTSISGNVATSMVLIIDNSYSMGYREEGVVRFEQARTVALELLDTLKPGDEAALITMNNTFQVVMPLTLAIDQVKAAVAKVSLSSHGTDVTGALGQAYSMLQPGDTQQVKPRREIHLLTDMQANAWDSLLEDNFIRRLPEPRPRLYVSSFGRPNTPNAYIRNVTISGAAAGAGSRIMVEVEMVGDGPAENLATLFVDGEKREQILFPLRTGAPAVVPIDVSFDQPGTYRCTVKLNEDGLAIDDSFEFNLLVDDRVAVLVVDGAPSIGALTETFYLRLALNRRGSQIDPTVVTIDEFPNIQLDAYKCLVLCNVSDLTGNELLKIESFLAGGGSVILFLGDQVRPEAYNSWNFIPAKLGDIIGRLDASNFMSFGRISPNHPIFAGIDDLRAAKVLRAYTIDQKSLAEGSRVIAHLLNNEPLIVEREYGNGRVMLVTTSVDADWTNLPLRRIYLALMHRMITYMSGRQTVSQAYSVGDVIEFRALARHYDQTITVTSPEGRTTTLRPMIDGSYAVASFSDTREPGNYAVRAHPDFTNGGGFSVNPDVRESDLTIIQASALEEHFAGLNVELLPEPGHVVQAVTESREGLKLWPLLFKLGLLFFCAEIVMANLFSRTVEHGGVKMQWFDYLKQRRGGGLSE